MGVGNKRCQLTSRQNCAPTNLSTKAQKGGVRGPCNRNSASAAETCNLTLDTRLRRLAFCFLHSCTSCCALETLRHQEKADGGLGGIVAETAGPRDTGPSLGAPRGRGGDEVDPRRQRVRDLGARGAVGLEARFNPRSFLSVGAGSHTVVKFAYPTARNRTLTSLVTFGAGHTNCRDDQ